MRAAVIYLLALLMLTDDHTHQHTHVEKAKLAMRPPEYPAIYYSANGG